MVYENDLKDQRVPSHTVREYHARIPQIALLTSRFPRRLSLSFSALLHLASVHFPPPKTITLRTKAQPTRYNITVLEGAGFKTENPVSARIDASCSARNGSTKVHFRILSAQANTAISTILSLFNYL